MDNQQKIPDVKPVTVTHKPGQRFNKVLSILSSLIPSGLTEMEINILSELHKSGGQLNTDTRKQICKSLAITSDYLNNYVKKLRKKGVIKNEDLHPMIKDITINSDGDAQYLLFILKTEV
jgi:hypothetical protein